MVDFAMMGVITTTPLGHTWATGAHKMNSERSMSSSWRLQVGSGLDYPFPTYDLLPGLNPQND